jgi:predicted nucleic acid-binding protein
MRNGIKPADALHLSCAINGGSDYFITVDDPLLCYKNEDIKIVDPIMFVKIWESGGE